MWGGPGPTQSNRGAEHGLLSSVLAAMWPGISQMRTNPGTMWTVHSQPSKESRVVVAWIWTGLVAMQACHGQM